MELGDTTDPRKPYPPPPAEPIRFFFACEPNDEKTRGWVKRYWLEFVRATEFVEDTARWSECKGMVFYSGHCVCSALPFRIAQMRGNFLDRDKTEALIYQFNSTTGRFYAA